MFELISQCKCKSEKPPYLDRIDELEKMDVIRLKGRIDRTTIPIIESRIKENRRRGGEIDKNVALDFAQVDHVDSATIAFHLMQMKEYEKKGFKVGFVNITEELRGLLNIFKQQATFQVYASENDAVAALNR